MYTQKKDSMIVNQVMLPLDRFPVMDEKSILIEVLGTMGKYHLGKKNDL